MSEKTFSFSVAKFNKLFPFYILIGNDTKVIACGKSIQKLIGLKKGDKFFSIFQIGHQAIPAENFEGLKKLVDQVVLLNHTTETDMLFKCQVEDLEEDTLLFLCTPWLESVDIIKEKNLTINDLSIYGSDINELLKTYNEQTKVLKKHEIELSDTTNRLSHLIANLQNAILVEDENRNILLVNEAFCNTFDIPVLPQQLIGANYSGSTEQSKHLFTNPEAFVKGVNELLTNKKKKLNDILELKNGQVLSRDYIPVFLGKKYKGHLWKYTNITESKVLERQLISQKRFYEQILNQIPTDLAILDKDHKYLFVNPSAIKDPEVRTWIIGKTEEEYGAYRNRPELASIERRKHFDEAVRSKTQKTWEEKMTTKDGLVEYHLRILFPVFDKNGELDIMIIYSVNITDRKKIEEQVKLSEARFKSIFDHSLALICVHDLEGKVLDTNNATVNTFGYSHEELVGSYLYELLPTDKQSEFENAYLDEIKAKGKAEGIMVALNNKGRKVYLLYQNYLVADDSEAPYVIGFSQDITPRIEAERALKKSEEKYRSIIANMNLGLLEVDTEEDILYANPSFCEMSGYGLGELTGRNAGTLFGKQRDPKKAEEVARKRLQDESDAYEMKVIDKNGKTKWWLISGAPIFDNNGTFKGSIGIHLDITVQKNLEQELRKAKSDAEDSTRAKEIFLANMSHEIRTPMNAILGIGRLLAKTKMEPQQKFYLNTIQTASNNLLVIINDLLDFSKIEAGKISLENIGFKLGDIISNAVHVLKHKAEEKGLSLSHHYSPNIESVLIGDPYRINQVLMNLMSNSLKFTEQGEVKINCSLVKEGDKYQKILFKVSDTGIGISKEFIDHLFDKFTQEDESITRKFGGTGLGMSISKQLIELMGGEISVQSEKNVGTTISFAITFPIGAKKDLPDSGRGLVDTQILKGKRILLVEDNDMNRLLASTVLSQYGAEVIEAEDGKIAIEKFENGKYDLILMDIQMPVKDGVETTRYIRANLDTVIPILALTANAYKQEEERCLAAGMNDFITKPFDEDKMVQHVAQWLGRETAIAAPTQAAVAEKESSQLYDLETLRSISRGDEDFINKMLELFIEEIPKTIRQMEDAYASGDWKTVGSLAHRMKPSIHNMGILSIANDVLAIESAKTASLGPEMIRVHLDSVKAVIEKVVEQLHSEMKNG